MKVFKKLSYTLISFIFVIGIAGCTKSCSFLSTKEPGAPEKERPNYGGINVPKVVKRDLVIGKGQALTDTQIAVFKHTAWVYDPKAPANKGVQIEGGGESTSQAKIGGGGIIKGFNDGIIGMQVGGRRQLIIPAELAYGDQGMEPHVFPGAIILIEVELTQIK